MMTEELLGMEMDTLIQRYPDAVSLLENSGFKPENNRGLKAKSVLKAHNINPDRLLKMLADRAAAVLKADFQTELPEKPNLIAYTFCPMKKAMWEGVNQAVETYRSETGDTEFSCYLPTGCTVGDPYADLWQAESEEALPDLLEGIGLGDFFSRTFQQRFVETGVFEAVQQPGLKSCFVDAGYPDPKNAYTIYSLFPKIIVVDKNRLGDRPAPRSWGDLLDPMFENDVAIGYSHDEISVELLLYIYKEFGESGLEKLAKNTRNAWNASRMAKVVGDGCKAGAAVYVLAHFFAQSCPHKENTELIWPEDGTFCTPTYLLVKKAAKERMKFITDFFLGEEFGARSAATRFPSLNPAVDNGLPDDAVFKWIGWDYLYTHEIRDEQDRALRIFKRFLLERKSMEEVIA